MTLPETVTVEFLGNRVGGIARPLHSPAVFVRGALPGETVRIKPLKIKKSFIEADLISVITPSKFRQEPFCRYFGKCGGCSLQHLDYRRQLHWKKMWIEKALRGLDFPGVEPVLKSPKTKACRNKVTFEVANDQLCLHAFRGDPIPVSSCPLMNESAASALRDVSTMKFSGYTTRISVRGSDRGQGTSLEFYGAGPLSEPPGDHSVFVKTRDRWECLRGDMLIESIGDLDFPVPPGGFFQVNTGAAGILTSIVESMLPSTATNILDLFGGVGTLGLPLAKKGFRVVSVEMNPEASDSCSRAAEMNCIKPENITIVKTRDRTYLSESLKTKKYFDVVITDPPRAGMGIRTSRQVRRLAPPQIIYVSCNPFSAARDIAILAEAGYRIAKVVPVDMFPNTDHVETVFLLEGSQ